MIMTLSQSEMDIQVKQLEPKSETKQLWSCRSVECHFCGLFLIHHNPYEGDIWT